MFRTYVTCRSRLFFDYYYHYYYFGVYIRICRCQRPLVPSRSDRIALDPLPQVHRIAARAHSARPASRSLATASEIVSLRSGIGRSSPSSLFRDPGHLYDIITESANVLNRSLYKIPAAAAQQRRCCLLPTDNVLIKDN